MAKQPTESSILQTAFDEIERASALVKAPVKKMEAAVVAPVQEHLREKMGGLIESGPDLIATKTDRTKQTDEMSIVFDREWLKGSFIISDEDALNVGEYGKWIRANRYASSADLKFTSTSPGMSTGVNPKPQFTRYCDIRNPGKIKTRGEVTLGTRGHSLGLGMGRYYSEAIDDNQQRIYLRFGTPQYMSMLLWITKSFDIHKAVLQNRGLITSVILNAVNIVGKAFAIFTMPLLFAGKLLFNAVLQPGKFISVRDNMYSYWATVENILNSITVRRTMAPLIIKEFATKVDNTIGQSRTVTSGFVGALNSMIPEVIDGETGRISIFAVALRAQAAFNKMMQADLDRSRNEDLTKDFTNYPISGEISHDTYFLTSKNKGTFFVEYIFSKAYKLFASEESMDDDSPPTQLSMNPLYTNTVGKVIDLFSDPNETDPEKATESAIEDNMKVKKEQLNSFGDYLMADMSDGLAFAVFDVDNTGSVGESFSNSAAANPIESVFNSISAKSRNIMSAVNPLTSIPILSDALGIVADAAALTLSNVSFGVVNPLLALAYGATISLPKTWDSSTASMPRASYKMKLISPYGNPYSQLFNIYIPLSMLMAGALPRSTGLDTHTAPFMCQLFDRGRVNTPLGMIDSFSITRGTANLAFTRSGTPNAIDVDFSIVDLNEVISVDVNGSGILSRAAELFEPNLADTAFTNYVNTLTGVDVFTQFYKAPGLRLKLAERVMMYGSMKDTAGQSALTASLVGSLTLGLPSLINGNNAKALSELVNR